MSRCPRCGLNPGDGLVFLDNLKISRKLALGFAAVVLTMAGMGGAMIRKIMKDKNVASLPELIAAAQDAGVRLVACAMSMDLMGIKKEELIPGVENGGVAMYLQKAEEGNVNLFI